MKIKVALFALCMAVVSSSYAGSAVQSLSPELKALLGKEMQALQAAMQSILPAYVSGDMAEVAKIASEMEGGFILKQKITPEQKHELMEKLPKAFLHRDQAFHSYAGMLEHVAQAGHLELVGFYYAKLAESCVSCHSEYAEHRFPQLVPSKSHGDQHHH